jgi:hypothetical protein
MTKLAHKPTIVETTWNTKQIQEETSRVLATQFVTTMGLLHKVGGEAAVKEFKTAMEAFKVEHFKGLGVKTPYELVKAIAEFDTNVYGSKVEIWGDEHTASMKYVSCGMWAAMEKHNLIKPEMKEEMSKGFGTCMQSLGQKFGFTTEAEMCTTEKTATVTFKK